MDLNEEILDPSFNLYNRIKFFSFIDAQGNDIFHTLSKINSIQEIDESTLPENQFENSNNSSSNNSSSSSSGNVLEKVKFAVNKLIISQSYNNINPDFNNGYLLYKLDNKKTLNFPEIEYIDYIKIPNIYNTFYFYNTSYAYLSHHYKYHYILKNYFSTDQLSINCIKIVPIINTNIQPVNTICTIINNNLIFIN